MKLLIAFWMALALSGILAVPMWFIRLRKYWSTTTARDKRLLWIATVAFVALATAGFYGGEN